MLYVIQNAVKQYRYMHKSREADQQENRRVMAEMAAASDGCVDKLLRRFVEHHALHDELLAGMLQRLARKDFDRPDVVRRGGGGGCCCCYCCCCWPLR